MPALPFPTGFTPQSVTTTHEQSWESESDLDIIVQQNAVAQSLREQMVPMDAYTAVNAPGRATLSVYNYGHSVFMNTGSHDVSTYYKSNEATVYDFSNCTVTKSYSGGIVTAPNGATINLEGLKDPAFRAEVSFQPAIYYAGRLSSAVNKVNVAYQARKLVLEKLLSGEEREQEIKMLDKFYLQSQAAVAASFSEMVGGFLDSHGLSGQTEKTASSVQALFDAWNQPSTAGKDKPDGHYTLQELDFAAVSIAAYQSVVRSAWQGSEVQQAVRVAMVDMKVERMALRGWDGSELLEVLRQVRPHIHQELLDAMDTYYSGQRKKEDPSRFPDADRGLFGAAYDTIMHAFRMSGDAMTAAGVGADVAKPLLNAAMEQSAAKRWTDELEEGGLWDAFYNPVYHGGMYEALAADWQGFLERFEKPGELNAHG